MTTAPDMTLSQFFEFDNAKLRKEGLNALYGTQTMRSVQALLAGAPQLLQQHVAQSVTDALNEALRVKVSDVLIAAWSQRSELAKYLDQSKFPKDEIAEHALGKHEVFSSHKPRLQLMLDQSPIGAEFEFDISVKLSVEAVTLRVQDGRIMFARLGRANGAGVVKCEDVTLFARPAKAVALPQTLSFGIGLAIARPKEVREPVKEEASAAEPEKDEPVTADAA